MSIKAVITWNGKDQTLNDLTFQNTYEDLINNIRIAQTSCEEFLTKQLAEGMIEYWIESNITF